MATIRKRGTKWQVQVRRNGCQPLSKSFHQKKDAEEWARFQERRADRSELDLGKAQLTETTLRSMLRRARIKAKMH